MITFLITDREEGGHIVYDDKAISELLDRSKEGIEQKESSMNEYLSSFKVIIHFRRLDVRDLFWI